MCVFLLQMYYFSVYWKRETVQTFKICTVSG